MVASAWVELINGSARAADIHILGDEALGQVSIVIEGKIDGGDADNFESVLMDAIPLGFGQTGNIYLFSPGGRLDEALRIAIMINSLGLNTVAPRQQDGDLKCAPYARSSEYCMCTSACAIIFAAGVERRGDHVGFHRATMKCTERNVIVENCGGVDNDLNRELASFLAEDLFVPEELLERAASISPSEMWYLSPAEVARYLPPVSPTANYIVNQMCSETQVKKSDGASSEIIRTSPDVDEFKMSEDAASCLVVWRSQSLRSWATVKGRIGSF